MTCEDNLRHVLSPILKVARLCGLFPVSGMASTSFVTRFRWCSALTLYSLIIWVSSCVLSASALYYAIDYDNGIITTESYIKCLLLAGPPILITPVFIYVAQQWSSFIAAWEDIERFLPEVDPRAALSPSVRRLVCVVIGLRIGISLLEKIFHVVRMYDCLSTASYWESTHMAFTVKYPVMFYKTTFPSLRGILQSLLYQMVVDLQLVCGPLLITAISRSITSRLKSLNSTLERHKGKVMPTKYWQIWRERYNGLSRLTHLSDDLLHPLIFVTCVQETILIVLLIYIVANFNWGVHMYLYMFVTMSLLYHFYLNMIVLMSTAAVRELSKRPLPVLASAPAAIMYNQEVGRFHDQVVHDFLALSGGRFFYISHAFIIKVVITILTYEILLLQANSIRRESIEAYIEDSLANVTQRQNFCFDTLRPIYRTLLDYPDV